MTSTESLELLWDLIRRNDSYIESTNTRATILVTFDTFVLGAIILNWRDILSTYSTHNVAEYSVIILLSITAIASLATLWKAFNVINPFPHLPNESVDYQSKFLLIAQPMEPENYLDHFQNLTEKELSQDLAKEVHSMSQALKDKFGNMKTAIHLIIWGQLAPLGVMVIIKFMTLTLDVSQKGIS